MAGFESYKDQERKTKEKNVNVYLVKMEDFAKTNEEISLQVRLHCLETAKGCFAACRQKRVFLIEQQILRQHLPKLASDDRAIVTNLVLS